MDLEAVRTFVAVAEAGQFQKAAVDLSITQQAVSKRIATLERALGVRLFTVPHAALSSLSMGRRSYPTRASCCASPNVRARPCAQATVRCAST